MNRCCKCNLFHKWDDLKIASFQYDCEFYGEDIAYTCKHCTQKEFIKNTKQKLNNLYKKMIRCINE